MGAKGLREVAAKPRQCWNSTDKHMTADYLIEQAVILAYVFFSSPGFSMGRQIELETASGIQVWSFPADQLLKAAI